jgi:hypothetical protein
MPAVPPGGRLTALVDIVKDPWSRFRRARVPHVLQATGYDLNAKLHDAVAGREGSELGPIFTTEQVTRLFQAVFQPQRGIFSPNYPLVPVQREQMRTWDFSPGWNLLYQPRHEVGPIRIGFAELRALAEHHDVTRLCIETRKDQIEKLDWSIKSIDEKDPATDARDRIDGLTKFWKKPDGERPFATWLRELLEDMMVIDAPCCEVRKNRGGDIVGLDIIDGATIKPLIDDTGSATDVSGSSLFADYPWSALAVAVGRRSRLYAAQSAAVYAIWHVTGRAGHYDGEYRAAAPDHAVTAFHGGQRAPGANQCARWLEPGTGAPIPGVVRLYPCWQYGVAHSTVVDAVRREIPTAARGPEQGSIR